MSPRHEVLAEGVELWQGDCRDVLPLLGKVDAVVCDPPYGMNWNTNSTRFSGGDGGQTRRSDWGAVQNDNQPFDPSPFIDAQSVILWGCNHFAQRLPVGTTLIWLKRMDTGFGTFLSDAELAWMKGGHGVYCFRDLSLQGESSARLHPTQKPLPLMQWCVQKTKGRVFDPFMGSGTTGVAAVRLGREFVGCEIEPRYFDVACRRISEALKSPDLFIPAPAPVAKQEALDV
jgi:site-specific DNA-methyltransferase (adenine-specific)